MRISFSRSRSPLIREHFFFCSSSYLNCHYYILVVPNFSRSILYFSIKISLLLVHIKQLFSNKKMTLVSLWLVYYLLAEYLFFFFRQHLEIFYSLVNCRHDSIYIYIYSAISSEVHALVRM